jgi:hypothetical protein
MSSPLQGLGAGLFLSHIYMEQFGGRLKLIPGASDSGVHARERGMTAMISIPRSIDMVENYPTVEK